MRRYDAAVAAVASRTSLQTLLGERPATLALRQGLVTSPAVALDFADVVVVRDAVAGELVTDVLASLQ